MRLWHIGIIVRDIDAAIAFYKGLPGGTDWVIERERSFSRETCIYGEPCTLDLAFGTIGGLPCELIQPVSNYSMQMEALKTRGEHMHHIAYVVGDKLEETVAGLLAQGGTRIWENNDGVVHVVFVRAKDGGMIYELSDVHPGEIEKQ